jgi:hypothetical protein
MTHGWNFLRISPVCIIHIVHNKESAIGRKSRAATLCARTVGKQAAYDKGTQRWKKCPKRSNVRRHEKTK